jgi:hypothetical protein
MAHYDKIDYMRFLENEIEIIKSRIQERGTGHLHTCVSVLEGRVREIEEEVKEMIGNY